LCGITLGTDAEFHRQHLEWERTQLQQIWDERLGALGLPVPNAPNGNRLRRSGRQLSLSTKVNEIKKHSWEDDVLQVVETVRKRRKKRSNPSGKKLSNAGSAWNNQLDFNLPQICFICNMVLPLDDDSINAHIDACLSTTSHSQPKPNSAKTRAPTPHEGCEDELDIQEEIKKYGETQYTERDIMRYSREIYNQEDLPLRKIVAAATCGEDANVIASPPASSTSHAGPPLIIRLPGASAQQALASSEVKAPATQGNTAAKETGQKRGISSPVESADDRSEISHSNALVVEALKARLRQVDAIATNAPRCKLCLEHYKVPVISVNCWHVHCEECWLQSLCYRKVCPQCQTILTAEDLRKVYL
jgi:hypothetical protein